jgi:hypothetical protein
MPRYQQRENREISWPPGHSILHNNAVRFLPKRLPYFIFQETSHKCQSGYFILVTADQAEVLLIGWI